MAAAAPLPLLDCVPCGETGKMLINFIFNLPFYRRACRSGIVSSEISSPLSWKHIGAEFASCRPPLPSAAIILRPHPALWPASLPGTGPVQNQKVSLFNPGHCHPAANRTPPHHPHALLPSARATLTPHKHAMRATLLPHYISYTRQGPGSGAPGRASHATICLPPPPLYIFLCIRMQTS